MLRRLRRSRGAGVTSLLTAALLMLAACASPKHAELSSTTVRPTIAATSTVVPERATIAMDQTFTDGPKDWLNKPGETAWYADGAYHLEPRHPGRFVALDAPLTAVFHDSLIAARFHKTGGPPGGGYGIIVADQGPEAHDGVFQGGQFLVFEVGDMGTVGAWARDDDHWVDLLAWTPSSAVQAGSAANDLTVKDDGQQLTFSVNGTQVVQVGADLPAGRVGVFVGGDGNQVVLDHFVAQSAAPEPTSASPRPAWVANTDGEGVYLRRTPSMWDTLRAYPDGTQLQVTGTFADTDGSRWYEVRTPDGTDGYVPAAYVVSARPSALVQSRSSPANSVSGCNLPGLHCGPRTTQYVTGYTREDGTYVRSYYRSHR